MSQGFPAVIELQPSVLEDILNSLIGQLFPPGTTFPDPRGSYGPYAMTSSVRLTLAPPGSGARAGTNLVGVGVTLQDTSSGDTGDYTIYFDVRGADGRLELHLESVDKSRSRPLAHLATELLHLALAVQGPLRWELPAGIKATVRTVLGAPGRALLFVSSDALATAFGLHPATNPTVPPPMVHALPTKTQGGGIIQVTHTESWAAHLDEAAVRGMMTEAINGIGTIRSGGHEVSVRSASIPRLIAGGLEVDLRVAVDGAEITVRGPLYVGYYLEAAESDAPQIRLSFNASKLQISLVDVISSVLYVLSALIPPLLIASLVMIPAALETWVFGPINQSLARAANQAVATGKTALIGEALRFLPPGLGDLLTRICVVRLDFGPSGVTIGAWYRPPPRSGMTKTAIKMPLEVHGVAPATFMVGWRRPGDLFAEAPVMLDGGGVFLGGGSGGTLTLALASYAPFERPASLASKVTLTVRGAALDGVKAVFLRSGVHRRALAITRQEAGVLALSWDLHGVPAGLWDLEIEWAGTLSNGSSYRDTLIFDNQVRTYVAAPEVSADLRPVRALTHRGELELLQLADGRLTPVSELAALRERLRERPPVMVDVVEVEAPLGPALEGELRLGVEVAGEGEFVVDGGALGRLRVRSAVADEGAALDGVEAALADLPRHELG
ncbi:MAG: hypothetical protein KC420_06105 [Myxococcales bacterium]|nr:hypothetical protein [Myxococcales bacterium]MCB9570082.1 hypothetical protein [Myxococcales bacterium]